MAPSALCFVGAPLYFIVPPTSTCTGTCENYVKKTERETKAKGLSPHARDNQLQVGSSGGPIRPLVAEILIFYLHRQGGKITARPLFCGRPMDWVRAETEQSLRTKNTVRYGSYAEYLRLTTMFFFFAEIAYLEAPTPRVFGQLSAETRQFTTPLISIVARR